MNWNEQNEMVDGYFLDTGEGIISRHNPLTGYRNYVLSQIEMLMYNLELDSKDDNSIKFYSKKLQLLSGNKQEMYFEDICKALKEEGLSNKKIEATLLRVKRNYSGNLLSKSEGQVLYQCGESNLMEYLTKSFYDSCDYGAMRALTTLAYQIIQQGVDEPIAKIKLYVNTNDMLKSWECVPSETYKTQKTSNGDYFIFFEYISLDRIDFHYIIYKRSYRGLHPDSMLELATADAIEEQFIKLGNRVGSWGMLAMQYCAVIEKEINELIKLHNFPDTPRKHLMWNDMKNYIKEHNIQLNDCPFSLYKMLDDLHELRNVVSHGGKVSESQYSLIMQYKEYKLFRIISRTKMELNGFEIDAES